MKTYRAVIGIMIALSFLGLSVKSQIYSYQDSWGKQGFTLLEESGSKLLINHSLTNIKLVDTEISGENWKTVNVPGNFLPNDEGAPNLPGSGRYVAIPQGAEVSFEIKSLRKEVIQNIDIAPAPAIPVDGDNSPLKYVKDENIYSRNSYYPAQPVIISDNFKLRGVDVVMLGITPFQYNPISKELIIYRDIEVEVIFKGGSGKVGEDRLRSRWWDPLMQNTLINANSLPKINYNQQITYSETPDYEYIIITPDDFEFIGWATIIKDFRTKQGIKTGIVTTTELGGNTVSAIETYVNNAYNNWDIPPSAVLLLGDYSTGTDGIISPKFPHINAVYPDYASDNAYADVDGDDLPDIILARITARNVAELEIMVTKFIEYELNPPTDSDFYDHPITALGWQTERWFQICSETIGGYLKNVQGKNPVRINAVFTGSPSTAPWSTATNTNLVVDYFGPDGLGYIPATPQELGGFTGGTAADVVAAINNGSYLLQHRDHGNYSGWGEPDFVYSDINSLTNVNNKLPFIFSINCQTGAFHMSSECFAEKFHRYTYNGDNSGALGIIAATETSYSFVNDTYVWGVFDNMFPDFMDFNAEFPVPFVMPAFANASGKHFLFQSNWPYSSSVKQITYRLFHHHGDAFMTLYTEVPQILTVAHASSILNTETSLSVTADLGSFIALTSNGEIIGTADGTGLPVNISFPPQTTGDIISVTVTKQNFYRYESGVAVNAGGVLAEFSADNINICQGETVSFTDLSSGNITSWDWSFSGGTPDNSNLEGPVQVTYNTSGIFNVGLIVSDGSTTDDEFKSDYIIVEALEADFSASPTTVIVGNAVTFTNLSSCNPDSCVWSFPGGTPASFVGNDPGQVFYNGTGLFDVSLSVYKGTSSNNKFEILHILVIEDTVTYCLSSGNATDEWIGNLTIGGQSNPSGTSGTIGYTDFTNVVFDLIPGDSYLVSFQPAFAAKSKFEYWTAWIDYNDDGDFEDADEQVFISPRKSKTTVTGTINIPASANGSTRMRIAMKRDAYAGPCENFAFGEVEDYTVSFIPPVPQPPVAEFTSDKVNVNIGGSVQFTDQSLNEPTSWLWVFEGGSPDTSTLRNPLVSYGSEGFFDVSLTVSNAEGSNEIFRTDYITVTDNPVPQYCIPIVSNANDHIVSVSIGSVTHNTGQGAEGYTYYDNLDFTFTPGSTYDITLVPFNNRNRNFWRVWVDFNNDGFFDGANEILFSKNNKKGTQNGTITIPAGVEVQSPDRIRITMKTGGAPTACEQNFNGEVEDYDVVYSGGGEPDVLTNNEELCVQLYPNPAGDHLNISVNRNNAKLAVKIYNLLGGIMNNFIMDNNQQQINLSGYSKGLYFIHINDGNESVLQKFIKR